MMDDDDKKVWFEPKRYGYGSGLPISWQGWAITIGFIVFALAVVRLLRDKPLLQMAIIFPSIALLLVITARTTRGGWRWRWGDQD